MRAISSRRFPARQKSPFKNNNYGGTAGGPIQHDRTFFFAAFEGERGRPNSTLAVTVPGEKDIAAARERQPGCRPAGKSAGRSAPRPLPAREQSRDAEAITYIPCRTSSTATTSW